MKQKTLLSLLGLLLSLPALAQSLSQSFEYQGLNYNRLDATSVEVGRNNSASGNIVIPETVEYGNNKYSVTSIGVVAFRGCSGLTSIEIPNSVTTIGMNAFSECYSLTSFVIPNSVTTIGDYVFSDCRGLTSVVIPNSVKSIGDYMFCNCRGLTSIKIPSSVTSIGERAFSNCQSLTSIDIPNSVTSIGRSAFHSCISLTSVIIPNSVASIGKETFSGCSGLTSVIIPNSVTSIGERAFSNCQSLTSIDIPNSVTSIGKETFSGCSGLTSVIIPNSVESIGERAFENSNLRAAIIRSENVAFGIDVFPNNCYIFASEGLDCNSLDNEIIRCNPEEAGILADGTIITDNGKTLYFAPFNLESNYAIPEGITKIKSVAFPNYISLKSLTIPSTIEIIEPDAFRNIKIEKVNFTDWSKWYANAKLGNLYSNPYWNSTPYVGGVQMVTPALTEGMTEIPDYINCSLQFKDEIELPRSIKRIGAYSFYNNKELFSVILPAGLEEIGASAFEGCELLENPSFPSSLKKIENGAYKGCKSITEITLPEGLSSLGTIEKGSASEAARIRVKGVFEGCTALEKAVVAVDIDYLADNIFNGCTALDKIFFPLKLKSIGDGAFEKCITLEEITFPATLESIGSRAFMGDISVWMPEFGHISKLTLPDAVKSIGSYAFAYQRIANLTIGKGLDCIADHAFYENPFLKEIKFSEGLKSIGNYAFGVDREFHSHLISNIGSVELPNSVTEIGEGAFRDASISSLVIPDQVVTLGSYSCGRPSVLTIGSSVKDIAADAFDFEKLYTIRLKAHMPPSLSAAFPLTKEQNDQLTLIVNKGRHDTYNTNARWKQIDRIIEDGESEVVIYLDGTYSLAEEIRIQSGYMPSVITKMKVNGPLSANDLRVIKENMISLTSLDLGEVTNITSIPDNQFAESLITNIVLPSNLETIGDGAFRDCRLLELSELPATVKKIGHNAFSGCPGVNLRNLPAVLEQIGSGAFSGSGITAVKAGEALAQIGKGAFSNCTLLERVDLEATTITNIPDNAFSGCSELDDVILPSAVLSIGASAFNGVALRNIDFAAEVATIGDGAFRNNRRLVAATLPEALTHVGSNLFENCQRLISVSMPTSITNVGTGILSNDRKLANLSCSAVEVPDAESGAFDDVRFRHVTLTIPTLSFRKYLSAPQWGKFENMKNSIKVEISKGVNVTNATEEEYQDMLKEDALEAAQEAAAQQSGETSPQRAIRRASARAKTTQNFAKMFDGAQLMSADGAANRVFITPEPSVKIVSILLDDEELISSYDGHSLLLPGGRSGVLKILTDAPDDSSVDGITGIEFGNEHNVYDIHGRLIKRNATQADIDTFAPGLYIIAGKKVIIK